MSTTPVIARRVVRPVHAILLTDRCLHRDQRARGPDRALDRRSGTVVRPRPEHPLLVCCIGKLHQQSPASAGPFCACSGSCAIDASSARSGSRILAFGCSRRNAPRRHDTSSASCWLAANKLAPSPRRGRVQAHRARPGVLALAPSSGWPALASASSSATWARHRSRALLTIERSDPALHGVLTPRYERSGLDPPVSKSWSVWSAASTSPATATCSGGSTSTSSPSSPAPRAARAASSTPRAASSELLVAVPLRRSSGQVYDPCCGSSGMFVHSAHARHLSLRTGSRTRPPGAWRR